MGVDDSAYNTLNGWTVDWSTADEAFVRFETSSSYMFCRPTVGAKY